MGPRDRPEPPPLLTNRTPKHGCPVYAYNFGRMRTFVRLLLRLLFVGVAAAALLALAERGRSAHADALPPITTPTLPAAPAPSPPTTPSLPAPPPLPAPPTPPVTAPTAPAPPSLPAPTLPSSPVPALPALPSVDAPAPPAAPTPALPGVPDVPGAPTVDSGSVTGITGPLPSVPDVAPSEPLLPDLPAVPAVPDLPTPLDRVLELAAAPVPGPPAPAGTADHAPTTPVAEPAPARFDPFEAGSFLVGVDTGLTPARGPPAEAPGSPHPCPGGGSSHPNRTDPAAFLHPATDDASRRAGSLAEARAYASTLLRDPLLRPD